MGFKRRRIDAALDQAQEINARIPERV